MGRKRESKLSPELIKTLIQTYGIKSMDDIKAMIRDLVGILSKVCWKAN